MEVAVFHQYEFPANYVTQARSTVNYGISDYRPKANLKKGARLHHKIGLLFSEPADSNERFVDGSFTVRPTNY